MQRAFLKDHSPSGVGLDDMSVLGPIFVLKLRSSPAGYTRKLVTELLLYPDDSQILELCTKGPPAEAFQVAAETRASCLSEAWTLPLNSRRRLARCSSSSLSAPSRPPLQRHRRSHVSPL